MEIQDAIDFYNARRKEGEPEMTAAHLGRAVFGMDSGKNGLMKMLNIINGTTARLHPDWIVTICKETGYSPNQLFKWK